MSAFSRAPLTARKGFAYVSFGSRDDAQKAVEKFNGFGFKHMILRVDLSCVCPSSPLLFAGCSCRTQYLRFAHRRTQATLLGSLLAVSLPLLPWMPFYRSLFGRRFRQSHRVFGRLF
jgi:RNA recognition motif-containing protein